MKETIERYREMMCEFLMGVRSYESLPSELKEAFGRNFRSTYHWVNGMMARIGETTWREIVALSTRSEGRDSVRIEGTVGDQAVVLHYYTRSHDRPYVLCSGRINGLALNKDDTGEMAKKFLLVQKVQRALDELENAFSQIAIDKEHTQRTTEAERAALQPLAHLLYS